MRWLRRSPFTIRRALRALDRIETRLAEQNLYLKRLADQFAPVITPVSEDELRRQTSVDFLNDREAGLVLEYVEKTLREQGRPPTDEEILAHLAVEATTGFHRAEESRER